MDPPLKPSHACSDFMIPVCHSIQLILCQKSQMNLASFRQFLTTIPDMSWLEHSLCGFMIWQVIMSIFRISDENQWPARSKTLISERKQTMVQRKQAEPEQHSTKLPSQEGYQIIWFYESVKMQIIQMGDRAKELVYLVADSLIETCFVYNICNSWIGLKYYLLVFNRTKRLSPFYVQ